MHLRSLIPVLLLGCGWNNLPSQGYESLDEPLWDAETTVPTVDGLYVRLPYAGGLSLLRTDGSSKKVDLGEGRVTAISPAPDQRTLVAFVARQICANEDGDDCGKREEITDVQVIVAGEVQTALDLDGVYNAVAYSSDGRFGVAYLDLSQDVEIQGVTNLTSIVVMDLVNGGTVPVSVGFAAEKVLFVDDAAGASKLVVISKNAAAVVDLLSEPPAVEVTYPLTLDPDGRVVPVGVDTTPDGRYALLSAQGSADLYTLDLFNPSINIVELSAAPSDMQVNAVHDRTVLVYQSLAAAEIIDHALFDVDRVELDEGMTAIAMTTDNAVLYDTRGNKDVYRLEVETGSLTEYRLENPPLQLHVAPGEEFAVALTRAEGGGGSNAEALYDRYPGMEVIDLRGDDSDPYILEGAGLGLAFSKTDTRLDVLVLQEGIDYLYRLDLYTGQSENIELSAPPVAIGTLPDGTFTITHTTALGLVSFLDPVSGEITEVSGFAAAGFLDDVEPIEAQESN